MDLEDLERIAALHWQAPDTEPLGGWLLRAASGFTGRANSVLPVGDPGVPLPEAVDAVQEWYRRRGLPPMIVLPGPLEENADRGPLEDLEDLLAERSWGARPGPAFVMTAEIAALPPVPSGLDVGFDAEPGEGFLRLYRYRGQDLPPIARTLLLSAPWQAFGGIWRDGRLAAVGRVSVAGPAGDPWAAITAVEVDAAFRRQGLGAAITTALSAAAAERGARRVLLQVEVGNTGARALYERCGFRYSHRYRYVLSP